MFVIDIAVPRDVDPKVNDLEHVYLYDVDDLQGVVEDNLAERRKQAAQAAAMIEEEVDAFGHWVESLKIAPTIVALREELLGIGEREFDRHRKRLGPMSSDQEDAMLRAMRSLTQKVLHRPIVHLKGSAERGDLQRVTALYREIFGIRPPEPREDGGAPAHDSKPPADAGPMHVVRGGKEDAG